jgi:ABC-2 type transport system permease protein
MRILALVGTGFVIQSVLRLRSEETSLHAEPVLAAAVSRARWAMSHIVDACGGAVILLAVAGLGVGVSYGAVRGDLGVVPGLLGAAFVYVPAMWLMAGLTFALVGLAPRAVAAAWVVLAACFLIGLLGELLGLPDWVTTLSPYDHVPQVPAADFSAVPLIVLCVLAAVLGWVGMIGLRRRDIG